MPLGAVANLVGYVLIAALGVAVFVLARGSPAARSLAVFAFSFGATGSFGYTPFADSSPAVEMAAQWVPIAAMVAMAFAFPASLARGERRLLVAPAAATAGSIALTAWSLAQEPAMDRLAFLRNVTNASMWDVMLGLAFLLTLRATATRDGESSRALGLASVALAVSPAIIGSPASSLPHEAWNDWTGFGVLLAMAGAWLVAGARDADPRLARNMAWSLLGLGLAGAAIGAPTLRGFGVFGLMMLATVSVLAYGILRHRLLGIDVKLRWTISKSSVAAVFVAVFFLASEGAQLLFGAGNEWAGLVAASLLVFAMAPLQRAAERLAEKAVPTAGPAPGPAPAPGPGKASDEGARDEAYRRALRIALRDRMLTREEEIHLHEVAEHMGIGAGRAMALRVEVEREKGVG